MKKLILLFLLAGGITTQADTGPQWLTSLPAAQAQAQKENKLVLLDFTGSDWCVACKALEEGVFSKPAFKDYAVKNLVLMRADFPVKDLPDALRTANNALQTKYKVDGFPTLIAMKADGTVVWTDEGYRGEPPSWLTAELDKARK
jgi:thiol:disulfide interchange protein